MRTINPLNLFSQRTNDSTRTRDAEHKSLDPPDSRRDEKASVKQEETKDDFPELSEKESTGAITDHSNTPDDTNEKSPLLGDAGPESTIQTPRQPPIIKRIATATIGSVKIVVAAVFAPGQWLIACFYDDLGHFSASMPFRRIARTFAPRRRRKAKPLATEVPKQSQKAHSRDLNETKRLGALVQDASALTSESELDSDTADLSSAQDSPARNTRSKSPGIPDETGDAPKKSIRIKTVNQEELRRRKQKRAEEQSKSGDSSEPPLTVATIKSPTGPSSALRLTRYPRSPAPPRPLIPRRQPSYSLIPPPSTNAQKTLIIDLDETLIHSMAKGGRMSTGHMVEVKLSSPVGVGNTVIAPQVPILYYVHKRPHCDEFLKKISRWYNLIVFTASVQEYADPVIDWLELERKYFSARYYRQHCTWRQGAYIKDLSQVEPDLSKVMILDNSPISYIFHEDNAIPIEGWISDPTDNDLLHLIPLLEGLQHATDVRALLALRLGESVA